MTRIAEDLEAADGGVHPDFPVRFTVFGNCTICAAYARMDDPAKRAFFQYLVQDYDIHPDAVIQAALNYAQGGAFPIGCQGQAQTSTGSGQALSLEQ
ncbi:MAG: hypothetical protein JJU07_00880 [Natronohydrobacter sp.]|nr:hypothetical protein [Natronohydrobacter sp.]